MTTLLSNRDYIAQHRARRTSTMTTQAQISPLTSIEVTTKKYAEARTVVAQRLSEYHEEIRALEKKHFPGIKQAAAVAQQRKAELAAELKAHPELFVEPRTLVLHGIKVGFQKGKGTIDWVDDEKVATKIEELLPEQYDVLVKVTRKPIAKALAALDVATLRRLGCTVEATGDAILIKGADSDIEKLVARVLEQGGEKDS